MSAEPKKFVITTSPRYFQVQSPSEKPRSIVVNAITFPQLLRPLGLLFDQSDQVFSQIHHLLGGQASVTLESFLALVHQHLGLRLPVDALAERYHALELMRQLRKAVVIFVFGLPCHPRLAHELAYRLQIPNVIDGMLVATLLQQNAVLSDSELSLDAYRAIASKVHQGLQGDLKKARTNGKSALIHGLYLDPHLYDPYISQGAFCDVNQGIFAIAFLLKQNALFHKCCRCNRSSSDVSFSQDINRYLNEREDFMQVIDLDRQDIGDMQEMFLSALVRHIAK